MAQEEDVKEHEEEKYFKSNVTQSLIHSFRSPVKKKKNNKNVLDIFELN